MHGSVTDIYGFDAAEIMPGKIHIGEDCRDVVLTFSGLSTDEQSPWVDLAKRNGLCDLEIVSSSFLGCCLSLF